MYFEATTHGQDTIPFRERPSPFHPPRLNRAYSISPPSSSCLIIDKNPFALMTGQDYTYLFVPPLLPPPCPILPPLSISIRLHLPFFFPVPPPYPVFFLVPAPTLPRLRLLACSPTSPHTFSSPTISLSYAPSATPRTSPRFLWFSPLSQHPNTFLVSSAPSPFLTFGIAIPLPLFPTVLSRCHSGNRHLSLRPCSPP